MPESLQTLDGVTERPNRKPPDSDNSFVAHARIHELITAARSLLVALFVI